MPMRRGRVLTMAGLAAAGLVACNLIAGFESEYKVATDGGAVDEAGNPIDGSTGDGAKDGGSDVIEPDATLVDADFCRAVDGKAPTFCADFEEDAALGATWETIKLEPGSTISRKPSEGKSGSTGLEVMLVQAGGASRVHWIVKNLGGGPQATKRYELEFDFRVASGSTNAFVYAALVSLAFPSGGSDQDHGLAQSNGTDFGGLQGAGTEVSDISKAWHHVKLVLEKPADGGNFYTRRMWIDDTSDTPNVETGSLHPVPAAGAVELRVGAFFTPGDASASIQVVYDNFVVRRF